MQKRLCSIRYIVLFVYYGPIIRKTSFCPRTIAGRSFGAFARAGVQARHIDHKDAYKDQSSSDKRHAHRIPFSKLFYRNPSEHVALWYNLAMEISDQRQRELFALASDLPIEPATHDYRAGPGNLHNTINGIFVHIRQASSRLTARML
jgi:hypothetical protein